MDMPIVMDFVDQIRRMIEDRVASLDQTDNCQILSNNNGSGLYDIKVWTSTGEEIVHDVVNASGYSFKNGDNAIILKIKGDLHNSIILGGNNPNTNGTSGTTINNTTIVNEGEEWRDGDIIHY